MLWIFLLTACWRHVVDVEPMSAPLPPTHQDLGRSVGKACQFRIFGLIPVGNNRTALAMSRAENGADGLTRVIVDETLLITPVGSWACVEVTGDRFAIWRAPSRAQPPAPEPVPTRLPSPWLTWNGRRMEVGDTLGAPCVDEGPLQLCAGPDRLRLTVEIDGCMGHPDWVAAVDEALTAQGMPRGDRKLAAIAPGDYGNVHIKTGQASCVLTLEE